MGYSPWGCKELDMAEVTKYTCIAPLKKNDGHHESFNQITSWCRESFCLWNWNREKVCLVLLSTVHAGGFAWSLGSKLGPVALSSFPGALCHSSCHVIYICFICTGICLISTSCLYSGLKTVMYPESSNL